MAFKTTSLQRVPFLQYCDIIKSELESHLTCPTHKRACPVWKIGWVLTFFEIFSLNTSLLFSLLAQLPLIHNLPCSRCEVTICRPTWRMQPLESILPHTHPVYHLAVQFQQNRRHRSVDCHVAIVIELDDGNILSGKPDQFDGKNPWVSG